MRNRCTLTQQEVEQHIGRCMRLDAADGTSVVVAIFTDDSIELDIHETNDRKTMFVFSGSRKRWAVRLMKADFEAWKCFAVLSTDLCMRYFEQIPDGKTIQFESYRWLSKKQSDRIRLTEEL